MGKKVVGWIMFIIGLGGLVYFISSMVAAEELITSSIWGGIVAIIWIVMSLRLALSRPKA